MNDKVSVCVDAMGGDNAPEQIVIGTYNAVIHNDRLICTLAGDEAKINAVLSNLGDYPKDRLHSWNKLRGQMPSWGELHEKDGN